MGRTTTYKEYNTASGAAVYTRIAAYDADNNVTADTVTTVRSDGTYVASTSYDYRLKTSDGTYDGAYEGVLMHSHTTTTRNGTAIPTSDTVNTYQWGDGAKLTTTALTPDVTQPGTVNTSSYIYDAGHLISVGIADGQPRTIELVNNAQGEVIKRDVVYDSGIAAPHELHYYVNGVAIGDVTNDGSGTSTTDYVTSVAEQTATPGYGAFQGGSSTANPYADFDQSYDPINGFDTASASSSYTVSQGDTLQNIAQQLWGDASLWYLIADANGLSSNSTLTAGMSLIIPNQVTNFHNTNSTYQVYNPNTAVGDTSPDKQAQPVAQPAAVQPPSHGGGCGVLGEVILAVVAVAVAVVTAGAAVAALADVPMTLGAGIGTVLSGTVAGVAGVGGTLGAVGIGVAAGAVGSIVSQGVGLATGIQSSFSWAGVAEAAIGGGIGAGVATIPGLGGGGILGAVGRGIVGNVATQGIEVATGLQKSFDWTGVAAAGVGAGIGAFAGEELPGAAIGTPGDTGYQPPSLGNTFVSGVAGDIANAATRTLINGSDFGGNLISALPDTIGQTIGNLIAGGIASQSDLPPPPVVQGTGSTSPSDPVNPVGQATANGLAFTQSVADKFQKFADNGDTAATTGQAEADAAQAQADAAQALADSAPPAMASAAQANADAMQAIADAVQAKADAKWALATRLDNAAEAAQTVVDQGQSANVTTTLSGNGVVVKSYTDGQTTISLAQVGPVVVSGINGDAGLVAGELAKLPTSVLNTLAAGNVNFVAVQDSVADLDPALYGESARGRTGTWDTISGAYIPQMNSVVIGTSGKYPQGAYDLVLHETGHAYDAALGKATHAPDGLASNSQAFQTAYAGTAGTYNMANPWDRYFTPIGNPKGYLSESFAESFADVYGGPRGNIPAAFLDANTPVLANTTRQSLANYWSHHQ